MQTEPLQEIQSLISAISDTEMAWDLKAAMKLVLSGLKIFPNSTELRLLQTRLQLLSEEPISSFEEISWTYEIVLSCRWWRDMETLTDLIGLKHNVLDQKWRGIELDFKEWDTLLKDQISSFLSMYFDYLNELGDKDSAMRIKKEYTGLIENIQESYLG